LKVVKWLTTQGLSIGLREDRHNDEGQGRAWSDLVLGASW
jgi:hypothetical protein